jgi:hypothetical protein
VNNRSKIETKIISYVTEVCEQFRHVECTFEEEYERSNRRFVYMADLRISDLPNCGIDVHIYMKGLEN